MHPLRPHMSYVFSRPYSAYIVRSLVLPTFRLATAGHGQEKCYNLDGVCSTSPSLGNSLAVAILDYLFQLWTTSVGLETVTHRRGFSLDGVRSARQISTSPVEIPESEQRTRRVILDFSHVVSGTKTAVCEKKCSMCVEGSIRLPERATSRDISPCVSFRSWGLNSFHGDAATCCLHARFLRCEVFRRRSTLPKNGILLLDIVPPWTTFKLC